MRLRRTAEMAGFVTMAGALMVSAAGVLLPEGVMRGAPVPGPEAAPALAAGGEEIRAMVEAWDAPPVPVAAAAPEMTAPEPAQPEISPPEMAPPPPEMPDLSLPEPMAPPEAAPDLPAPVPDPEPEPAPEAEPEPSLALAASARPEARPARRQPEPARQAAPRAEAPRAEAPRAETPPAAPQAQARQAGAGGQQAQSASGGGGASAAQRADALRQWGAQVAACIQRRAPAPRGLRQGGRAVLALDVAQGGTIRGVGLRSSSGVAEIDAAAVSAAQRAGRCPGAPAGLDAASYQFDLPITIAPR